METWPASLPQFVLVDGYGETTDPRAVAMTETDAPYPRGRRRTDNAPREYTAKLPPLTYDQTETFDQFYLANAALAWTWVAPISRATATFRFVGLPQYRARPGTARFDISMQVEAI